MDSREFLRRLEEAGQLDTVEKEVDWNLQAGAILSMSNRISGPAIHFKKVKDYPGMSLAGGIYTGPSNLKYVREKPWSRQAIGLRMDPTCFWEEFATHFMEAITYRIPPTRVSTGPCKANILTGEKVDILKFPVPYLHEGDGGRYGTLGVITVRDPESGWQHWGLHRWMVVNPREIAVPSDPMIMPWSAFPPYEFIRIAQKWWSKNEAMPFSIVIGGDPAFFLSSAMYCIDRGVDQMGIGGGLAKEPLVMVKTETSDLLVPANAEIVIEGEAQPWARAEEGPFPEMVTYFPKSEQPLYTIKAITYRDNPIFTFSAEAGKYSDILALRSSLVSIGLTQDMRDPQLGYQSYAVKWIYVPPESMMATCIVSIDMTRAYAGTPSGVAYALFNALPLGKWFDKLFICEHKIPAGDWSEIMNLLQDQVNPADGFRTVKGEPCYLCEYRNDDARHDRDGTKLYIDSTRPTWWEKSWIEDRHTFETFVPEEVVQKVMSRWKEYGLPGEPYLERKTLGGE